MSSHTYFQAPDFPHAIFFQDGDFKSLTILSTSEMNQIQTPLPLSCFLQNRVRFHSWKTGHIGTISSAG